MTEAVVQNKKDTGETLVDVSNLKMHFPIYKGLFRRKVGDVKAVDGLSFEIRRGETSYRTNSFCYNND